MESCRDKTIDAFNAYVDGLKVQSKAGTRISLSTFDSESIDLVFGAKRIAEAPKLTRDTFVPRASTPLFDAVAATVASIDKVTLLPDERVALAILTDGLENASREMTAEAVRKLLMDRQERCNWLVQYLGANQDAWAAAAQIGVAAAHSIAYGTDHIGQTMQSMATSQKRYRMANVSEARKMASFTDEERASAKGQKS